MNKYKKYLGYVVENKIIDGIIKYYDFSSDKIECAFTFINDSVAVNCDLFISKNFN